MTLERSAWIEALRSGRYKQSKGVLKSVDGAYCCLGVGLDLVDSSRWGTEAHMNVSGISEGVAWGERETPSEDGDDNVSLPSSENCALLGIVEEEANDLGELNDDGYTFEDIAKVLERADGDTSIMDAADGYRSENPK